MTISTYALSYSKKNGHRLTLIETPRFWYVLETIACWVCSRVFRDRWCHRIAGPVMHQAWKLSKQHEIPVSEDQARDVYNFRGWGSFWFDEDDD